MGTVSWSTDFGRGFWIGLGVGAALLVLTIATGVLGRLALCPPDRARR